MDASAVGKVVLEAMPKGNAGGKENGKAREQTPRQRFETGHKQPGHIECPRIA
jgi:hypothetical protein